MFWPVTAQANELEFLPVWLSWIQARKRFSTGGWKSFPSKGKQRNIFLNGSWEISSPASLRFALGASVWHEIPIHRKRYSGPTSFVALKTGASWKNLSLSASVSQGFLAKPFAYGYSLGWDLPSAKGSIFFRKKAKGTLIQYGLSLSSHSNPIISLRIGKEFQYHNSSTFLGLGIGIQVSDWNLEGFSQSAKGSSPSGFLISWSASDSIAHSETKYLVTREVIPPDPVGLDPLLANGFPLERALEIRKRRSTWKEWNEFRKSLSSAEKQKLKSAGIPEEELR